MSSKKFDAIDVTILNLLQTNGNITNKELAQEIGLAASSTLQRVSKLTDSGIIKKSITLLDETELGYVFSAMVSIKIYPLNRGNTVKLTETLNEIPYVKEIHFLDGEVNTMLKVVAKSIEQYEQEVVEKILELDFIEFYETSIIKSTEKEFTLLPLE